MPEEGRNPEKSGREEVGWGVGEDHVDSEGFAARNQNSWAEMGIHPASVTDHKSGQNLRAIQTKISQMTVKGKDKPVCVAL